MKRVRRCLINLTRGSVELSGSFFSSMSLIISIVISMLSTDCKEEEEEEERKAINFVLYSLAVEKFD